jgi:carbonic anhydrase
MKKYKQLLLANEAWSIELRDKRADFFSRQAMGQNPDFLWIGCSDSRVSAEQLTMTQPGSMFIHRNIANVVDHNDLNLMSVLQFAVETLKVEHIIICGHYGCGGIAAALKGGTTGAVDHWLASVRGVKDNHAQEIDAAADEEARTNRLVEVNVRDQLVHLARTEVIQAAFAAGSDLGLHGWVYDLRDGLIKTLLEIDRTTILDDVDAPPRVLV